MASQTKFWSSASSMTIDGGTFETDQLINHTGVAATVSISDPTGGTALTVGANNGSSTFDGLVQDAAGGAGSIAKVGSGTCTLTNNSNSYSGQTRLVGGTFILASDLPMGTGDLVFAGGTFDPSAPIASTRNLIVEPGGGTIDVDSLYGTSGTLSGSGTLSKTGMGVATFGGAQDSFTGVLVAGGGVVILGDGGASGVPFPGTLSVAPGVTVMLQDSDHAELAGTAALSGGLLSAPNGIDLGATGQINGFGTVASAIAGSTGSQINATGILTLGDAGSTSGFDLAGTLAVGSNQVVILDADRAQLGSSTTLGSGGTLIAGNGFDLTSGETLLATGDSLIQGQFTNNGVVDIAAGQTLVFNDDVDGAGSYTGTGTVQFNQTVSPGNSPADVAFGGDLMLTGTSVLEIELGGSVQGEYDFLDVTGDVSLGGPLDVSLLDPFVLEEYQQFDILSVGGDLSGTFTGLAEGDLVGNFGGTDLFITYQAGNGNDIALSTVPEPAALTLLALGLASLCFVRRRRKR